MLFALFLFAASFSGASNDIAQQHSLFLQPEQRASNVLVFDTAKLFSEFGKIKQKEVKAKMDEFFADLNANPEATGCVMSYGEPKDVEKYEKMFIEHVKESGFDVSKITFIGAGKRKEAKFQLWVIPKGASYPNPEPQQ